MTNTRMTNTRKKALTAVLSVALVLVLAIGGTFAYLAANAGSKTNVFTFADNIRGVLGEPNWNPKDGENLVPGKEIKKDPMITNTSTNGVTEYAAVKVTFQSGKNTGTAENPVYSDLTDVETARLLSLVEIDWNTTDWQLIAGAADGANQTWAYKNELAPGEVSNPLFSTVTIKGDISDADMAWLAGIVLSHTPDCYTYGVHDDSVCTITYKHHANCAVFGDVDAASTIKGGTTASGKTCDCTPAEQHEADCPSLIGTLKGTCAHTPDATSIQGFNIKNTGSVIQADQFTSSTSPEAITAFAALFA